MAKRFSTFGTEYQYFVNEEKGVVVAKLCDIETLFRKELIKMWNVDPCADVMRDQMLYVLFTYTVEKFFADREKELHNMLTAKAVCSPEDEFDLEVGRNIAKRKLEIKVMDMWAMLCGTVELALIDPAYEARDLTDIAYESYNYRIDQFTDALALL